MSEIIQRKSNKWFGWVPDLPDKRDHLFSTSRLAPLPVEVDLRTTGNMSPIYDQGNLGSCTANALAAAYSYEAHRMRKVPDPEGKNFFLPSRLFIYYHERVAIDTVAEDSGAMIRDGIKALVKLGAPAEKYWPYDDGAKRFRKAPTITVTKKALVHQAIKYLRVGSILAIQQALAGGWPVTVGFTVYESFESVKVQDTGLMPAPSLDDGDVLGGHAVLIVGYKQIDGLLHFIVRNSWGEDWGDAGYFYMPYNVELEDCWVLQMVEG